MRIAGALVVTGGALAMVLAACAASPVRVHDAREAHYGGERHGLFEATERAVEARYQVIDADEAVGVIYTHGKLRSADGRMFEGHLAVRIVGDRPPFQVTVDPVVFELDSTSARGPLAGDDPQMPGWVVGRAEALQVEIYQRLRKWTVAP